MGRKQKERRKKKKNQTILATAAATATSTSTAPSGDAVDVKNRATTAGRSSSSSSVGVGVGVGANLAGAVAAAHIGMRTTTTKMRDMNCYHGTTANNVAMNSGFRMVIDEYLIVLMDLDGKTPTEVGIVISNLYVKHEVLIKDFSFIPCLFALATNMFLISYGTDEYSACSKQKIQAVLRFGINIKYLITPLTADREKYYKYCRDVEMDRGIINVLYRETHTCCQCMTPYKEEAKRMDKVGICHACKNEYQKQHLKRCSRCQNTPYCSNECMKKDWSRHKTYCLPYKKTGEA